MKTFFFICCATLAFILLILNTIFWIYAPSIGPEWFSEIGWVGFGNNIHGPSLIIIISIDFILLTFATYCMDLSEKT